MNPASSITGVPSGATLSAGTNNGNGTWTLLPIVHTEHSHVLGVPTSVTYGCMMLGFTALMLTSLTQALRAWDAKGNLSH